MCRWFYNLILFFGFLREIVFSSKLGISNFSDNFFYYYLVVEDFNAIIYTGLMFGLVSFYTKEKLSNQDIVELLALGLAFISLLKAEVPSDLNEATLK